MTGVAQSKIDHEDEQSHLLLSYTLDRSTR